MKRFSFSLVAVMVTLMVLVVSCGMPMGATGGYYEDEPVRRNVYYSNPYGSNVIVVERDPYTGRYYEVAPYGGNYSNSYPYNYRYDRRYYGNGGGGYSRGYNRGNAQQYDQQRQQQAQQQQQERRETIRQMESSKESILGKKKD